MGLLSDPSLSSRNKLGLTLAKHIKKICFVLYVAGLAWFVCLANTDFNHATYLSENALSPGLVYPEVRLESGRLAATLLDELQREQKEHKTSMPYAWIAAKMRQFGLETYVHNFTLRYPLDPGKEFYGKNVYGILRAPRIGSTEGIVYSAPYRPLTSTYPDITASVPILLSFADFVRSRNYWSKDLIFLVTEQEQLGMQAWLQAYHDGDKIDDADAFLHYGSLPARAGALQAALNLEIQDLETDYINIKIEGLNGKLPNLDLFNLVQRITSREGVTSGYKQTPRKKRRSIQPTLQQNLQHMISMLATQATGVPNGNHGLYHPYRIEALTLEGIKRTSNTNKNNRNSAAMPMLKIIEGISRSLNNLLERFHQSFFFYIIVQNDRYVSIGDYMPSLIALAGSILIKAFLTWISLIDAKESINHCDDGDYDSNESQGDVSSDSVEEIVGGDHRSSDCWTVTDLIELPYIKVILYVCATLLLGYICNFLPLYSYLSGHSLNTATATLSVLLCMSCVGLVLPFIYKLPPGGLELLHIALLILLGVTLIVIGLLNFALGFFISLVTVPLATLLSTNAGSGDALSRTLVRVYAFSLNPLCVIYIIMFVLAFYQYPELSFVELSLRAGTVLMDVISYALMDSIIYGNWLFVAVSGVLLPIWMLCWNISVSESELSVIVQPSPTQKLKTN